MSTLVLVLIGLTILGNLPLLAAVIGHVREQRMWAELDDIDRIEGGFFAWHDPTPPQPLRAVAWPVRQSPTDLALAYAPVWSPPDWAATQLRIIVAAERQYRELVAA